jgi:uncharacterized DUF497 family protein
MNDELRPEYDLRQLLADPDHSGDEHRYVTVGLSNRGRILMVAHAERHEGRFSSS